ncbi:MAG: DUF937 domain-containing protein [Methanomicrobiales archaeon]|nr:DUF937 domain-containing protein [Methanomicrobiales archaeon]
MVSIVEDLMKQVATGDNLSAISKAVGGDQNAVKSALGMGLPLIVGSMANKAATPGGADMLMKTLSQTGSSNPMDNLGGFLANPQGAIGATMVTSLLGSQMTGIQTAISQKTGLPPAIVGKVLAIATPIVMGYVSKMFMGKKVDQAGLSSLLGDQAKMALASSPDAANMAKQLMANPEVQSGIVGSLKKFLKG